MAKKQYFGEETKTRTRTARKATTRTRTRPTKRTATRRTRTTVADTNGLVSIQVPASLAFHIGFRLGRELVARTQ